MIISLIYMCLRVLFQVIPMKNVCSKAIFSTISFNDSRPHCLTDERTSCEGGDVRLRDGTDPSNGRVEICQHRTWGTVCSGEWDDNAARVVCGQLLYDPEGEYVLVWFSLFQSVL